MKTNSTTIEMFGCYTQFPEVPTWAGYCYVLMAKCDCPARHVVQYTMSEEVMMQYFSPYIDMMHQRFTESFRKVHPELT